MKIPKQEYTAEVYSCLDAGPQVTDAVPERLAHRSATGETGSMKPTAWKTKNRGTVTSTRAWIFPVL